MSGMRHDDPKDQDRLLVRDALRAAAQDPEPDIDRLLGAVPAMLAESRRRRLLAQEAPLGAFVPLLARAVPRLAAATAILALCATVTLVLDARAVPTQGGERTDIDAVLLGGAGSGGADAGSADTNAPESPSLDDLLLGRSSATGDENG